MILKPFLNQYSPNNQELSRYHTYFNKATSQGARYITFPQLPESKFELNIISLPYELNLKILCYGYFTLDVI